MIFRVLVLIPLGFLGLVAFVRCLEIAIDDWEFVTCITRLRHPYHQLVPELAPLMSQAVADEGVVVMLSARWQKGRHPENPGPTFISVTEFRGL